MTNAPRGPTHLPASAGGLGRCDVTVARRVTKLKWTGVHGIRCKGAKLALESRYVPARRRTAPYSAIRARPRARERREIRAFGYGAAGERATDVASHASVSFANIAQEFLSLRLRTAPSQDINATIAASDASLKVLERTKTPVTASLYRSKIRHESASGRLTRLSAGGALRKPRLQQFREGALEFCSLG